MVKKGKALISVLSKIHERRPKASACLVEIYGQQIGRKIILTQGELVVGRSQKADVQIDQESVSRKHARFSIKGSGITIEDLGSTNGTYINDEPANNTPLQNQDQIKVGRTIYKFLADEDLESAYRQELLRLAAIDGLTECFNEAYLTEQLTREVSRAYRYARPLSLVLFDLEGMGRINKELGQLAGDTVLTQLAHRVRNRLRREDIFARLNGGLFAVVAPESAQDDVGSLVQKIQKLVTEQPFYFEEMELSIGLHIAQATLREEKTEKVPLENWAGDTEKDTETDNAFCPLDMPTAEMHLEETKTTITKSQTTGFSEPAKALFDLAVGRLSFNKRQRIAPPEITDPQSLKTVS